MICKDQEAQIQTCVQALKQGRCIAYPTEAVWGLGCDPNHEQAVAEILRLKRRPVEKGLILAADDISAFSELIADLPADIVGKMHASWPGHVTWLVPHNSRVPAFVSGDSDKVAIRVSAHPIVRALSEGFAGPIVSTSANPAGSAEARTSDQVRAYFNAEERLVYAPGSVGAEQKPSTIIDALSGDILRN